MKMKQNSKKITDSTSATTTATKKQTERLNAELEKEINLCIEWIQNVPTITKAINYHRSSYGYKHDVERCKGCYISNDSFIQAARQMGLMEVKQPGSTQNYCYNLRVPKAKSKI